VVILIGVVAEIFRRIDAHRAEHNQAEHNQAEQPEGGQQPPR